MIHSKECVWVILFICGSFGQDLIEDEPNGPIDFSNAKPDEHGNLCVIKTKMIETVEKQQVKECWTQNVTQCHDSYVTEFLPMQERQCEDNYWKACKITFKDKAYNTTLTSCMTPLVRECSPDPGVEPKTVCKTWFESVCNTTYNLIIDESSGQENFDPVTWCDKIPQKICAPDHCKMIPGAEECHDKIIESTIKQPTEICDLRPSKQCKLVTNLVPHLTSQKLCREIPKEVCNVKDDLPQIVMKPQLLKWCTHPNDKLNQYRQIVVGEVNNLNSQPIETFNSGFSSKGASSFAANSLNSGNRVNGVASNAQMPTFSQAPLSTSYGVSAPTGYGIPNGTPLSSYDSPFDHLNQKRSPQVISLRGRDGHYVPERFILRSDLPESEQKINIVFKKPPGHIENNTFHNLSENTPTESTLEVKESIESEEGNR